MMPLFRRRLFPSQETDFRIGQKVKVRTEDDMKHIGGQLGVQWRSLENRVFIVRRVGGYQDDILYLEGLRDQDGFFTTRFVACGSVCADEEFE